MLAPLFFVKLALTGLTASQLIDRANAHVAALTANPVYPTPNPTIITIKAAITALDAAETNVINNGGRQDYLIRNQRMKELRDLLTLLGSYVQVTSGGDPEKIVSAGFKTRKVATPVGILPAPGNLRAVASLLLGVIDLRWDRVAGRLIYQLFICIGDPLVEANWKPLVLLGSNAHSAKDLISGTPYTFRVQAIGAAGPSPMSDTATEKPR